MSKPSGFTLIELLVVVLIIGILASVALPQYTKAVEKSRMTEAMTALKNVAAAEEIYKMSNGNFTGNVLDLDIQYPGIDRHLTGTDAFDTKNFRVMITEPGAVLSIGGSQPRFSAIAQRMLNGQVQTAGELAYFLRIAIDESGNVTRTCHGSETLCKSVSGGACSSSPKDWCYQPASSGGGTGSGGHVGGSVN